LPRKLASRRHVPEAKFGAYLAVIDVNGTSDNQGFGLYSSPIREAWHRVDVSHLLKEGGSVERTKQSGAFEIGLNDV
jgi:hypothetical protein